MKTTIRAAYLGTELYQKRSLISFTFEHVAIIFFDAVSLSLIGAEVRCGYSNCSITISGFDPSRSGGPHVPAPLDVKTCIFPIRLKPYTNCR